MNRYAGLYNGGLVAHISSTQKKLINTVVMTRSLKFREHKGCARESQEFLNLTGG